MSKTLYVSNIEYDYHTLLKIASLNYRLGNIKVHAAEGGYLISFANCDDNAPDIFMQRLREFEQNIWSH